MRLLCRRLRVFFIMSLSSIKLFFSNFQGGLALLPVYITQGEAVLLRRRKNFLLGTWGGQSVAVPGDAEKERQASGRGEERRACGSVEGADGRSHTGGRIHTAI